MRPLDERRRCASLASNSRKGREHRPGTSGRTPMKAISVAAILLLATFRGIGTDHRRAQQRRQEHRQHSHLRHGLPPAALQPAQSDQQEHRQAAGAGLEPQPRQPVGRAGAADRPQRRDVRDQRPAHRRDRRRHRQADLAPHARLAGRDAARRVLRRLQQGRRDLRRQGLPHHARRACDRARRQDRQGGVEVRRSTSGRTASR